MIPSGRLMTHAYGLFDDIQPILPREMMTHARHYGARADAFAALFCSPDALRTALRAVAGAVEENPGGLGLIAWDWDCPCLGIWATRGIWRLPSAAMAPALQWKALCRNARTPAGWWGLPAGNREALSLQVQDTC